MSRTGVEQPKTTAAVAPETETTSSSSASDSSTTSTAKVKNNSWVGQKTSTPAPVPRTSNPASRSLTSRQGSSFRMSSTIGTKPTPLTVGPMHFLIMDTPRNGNLHLYIKEMRKHSVTDVVRVCEPTYQGGELRQAGITLHEMEYPDGHSPPPQLIDRWLQLVETTFYNKEAADGAGAGAGAGASSSGIAIHCVAGLGRAPVMIAIALIEFAGMDAIDAVRLIREHRRGAINEKQLLYLEGYKRRLKSGTAGDGGCCIVM